MNEAELREAFESRRPSLNAMGEWVTECILLALQEDLGSRGAVEKFLQIPPKPRVKETESFLEKALVRKRRNNPLAEITDQVGVRFVVLLLEDIDRIGRIIQSLDCHWQKDRDHEQERLEKPDYFAYQSDHYVVRTKAELVYGATTIPANLPCEIQVRTILQHAYAEMAHSSDYKPSIRLPAADQRRVRRALSKGSALIETTDDVFRDIKDRLREYSKSTDALLSSSSEIYQSLTGKTASPLTPLGQLIGDTYRELLKTATPEVLRAWVNSRPWLGETLSRKRSQSIFYRDAVVILIGWLVTEHQMAVPSQWPIDISHLEDLYVTLGISTQGIL